MNKDFWDKVNCLDKLAGKATPYTEKSIFLIRDIEGHWAVECPVYEDLEFHAAANPAMIKEMIAEMRKLKKEADWLAAALVCACTIGKSCDFGAGHICRHCEKGWSKEYWRDSARKAVMDGARLSRNPENDCA